MATVLPAEDVKSYRCPCCGFLTLYGRGQFELCPVCFWEDDGQDEDEADIVRGGPNGTLSLKQAQENFVRYRAAEEQFAPKARKPLADEL